MGKIQRVIFKAMLCGVLALLSYAQFATANSNKCESLFEKLNPEIQNKIEDTIKNLAELKINLDTAKAKGISSIELTALADNFKNKSTEFYKYVRKNNLMTKDQYINHLRQMISDLQSGKDIRKKEEAKNRESQHKEFIDSIIDGTRLVMHRIEPGPFKMGEVGSQFDKLITEPFEMAAIPTTQFVWKKVVELAHIKLGDEYKNLSPKPSTVIIYANPVGKVSYDDVQLWIKALNELSQKGDSSLVQIISNHKAGDIYRLPTEEEWEFVIRGRGKFNEAYHFGNDESELKEYAHYGVQISQAVALLKPLVVDRKNFYDMHGNTWEWTNKSGPVYVLRGGGLSSGEGQLSASRLVSDSNFQSSHAGFRLVRTVSDNK